MCFVSDLFHSLWCFQDSSIRYHGSVLRSLYVWIYHVLFIHSSIKDVWVVCTFWLLCITLLRIFVYRCLWTYFLLGLHEGVEFLSHMVTLFNFLKTRLFSKAKVPFYSLTNNTWKLHVLHILANTCYCLYDYSHPGGDKVVFHCYFGLHFPNDK